MLGPHARMDDVLYFLSYLPFASIEVIRQMLPVGEQMKK